MTEIDIQLLARTLANRKEVVGAPLRFLYTGCMGDPGTLFSSLRIRQQGRTIPRVLRDIVKNLFLEGIVTNQFADL